MQLLNAFNPLNYDPSQGGASWPLGKHPVIIESAEVKATQDNASGYLQLNCKIIDGPSAGFTGAYRLNLYNQSAKAAEIAHRQLSAICHVTQTFQLGADGTQIAALFNKPFVVEVGEQKGEEAKEKGYTEIKRVFDMNLNEPGKQGSAGSQAAPAGFGGGQSAPANNAAPAAAAASAPAAAWGAGAGGGAPAGASAGAAAAPAAGAGAWSQAAGGDAQAKPAWGQR